jgi:4-amino-4-deoxy-L-arabinose transferase-like glycosyltransferase
MAQMHLFIYLMIRLRAAESYRKSLVWAILAGLVLGITTLTRAILPLFAILTALWFLFRLSFWQSLLRLIPVALISLLLLLPWMLRSYEIYHRFVAVALNTGDNLWQGANAMTIPLFEAGYDVQWSEPPEEWDNLSIEIKQDLLTQAGLDYLRENPELIPRLLWLKFLVHWSIDISPRNNPLDGQSFALDENGDLLILQDSQADLQDIDTIASYEGSLYERVARPVHIIYYGSLLLLAIFGILLSLRQWREVSLLWFLQLSMMIMYLIFHPSTRYRVPTDPLLFVFSAYSLLYLIQWWKKRRA